MEGTFDIPAVVVVEEVIVEAITAAVEVVVEVAVISADIKSLKCLKSNWWC
jgi:hypothetical protein